MKKIINKAASILVRKTKKGFTLAEVLITLLIIGVISSIVIPNLIADMQDAQLKTAAKKCYSTIEQATRSIMMNNGDTMIGFADSHVSARDAYLQYMPYAKKCESYAPSSSSNYCGSNLCNYFIKVGNFGACDITHGGAFTVLNNGMFLLFLAGYGVGDPATCSPFCAEINIDINGFQGPNQWGKDILYVYIKRDRVAPQSSFPNYLKQ